MERQPFKHSENPSWMRRTFFVPLLFLLFAWVPGLLGQRAAAGRFGNSGRGISGGGFRGGHSAARSFGGFPGSPGRAFRTAPRMTWTAPHSNFVPRRSEYPGFSPWHRTGNRRPGEGRDRYRRPYTGYGYGVYPYTYVNSWELLPWDLGYPDSIGNEDETDASAPDNTQVEPYTAEPPPPEQDQGYRPQYAPAPYQPEYSPAPYRPPGNAAVASTPPDNQPKLTLIFKDGHTLAIKNYVLTPKEVIVMDDAAAGRVPRIPLFELNLSATKRAAQQAGLDFSPPSA